MEKTLFNQVGEVKGKQSSKQDSFSFQFTPQNDNLKRTRGSLFTLVTVKGEAENKYEKASQLYQLFQSSYYAKASGSVINSLSETLDHVQKEYVEKVSQEEKLNFALVAAVFWGSVLYIAKFADNLVYVARNGKLKKLDFNKVASGVLEDQDTVLLASDSFETIAVEDLSGHLNHEKFEDVLANIDKSSAPVEGAVSLVIRLSVNAPEENAQLAIAEVDEKGEVEEKAEETPTEPEPLPENVEADKEEQPVVEESIEKSESTVKEEEYLPQKKEKPLDKVKGVFSGLGSKLVPTIKERGQSLLQTLAKPWRKAQPGELVDHVAVRRARIMQIVGVIVAVFLISIILGVAGSRNGQNQEKNNTLIASAETKLEQARNFKTIDPNRAKNLVEAAKKDLTEAKKSGSEKDKISQLEKEAASLIAEITRSYLVENIESLYDFSKLSSGAKVERLALLEGVILATDQKTNSLYTFSIASKEGKKLQGDYEGPKQAAAYPAGFYVQASDGIFKVDKNNFRVTNVASSANWGEIVAAAAFQSQSNLYLLDRDKNEIWRYVNNGTGLAAGRAYLTGQKPDLKEATAIAIDDLVWVTTSKGTIYKISRGQTQEFSLSNISEPFGEVVDLYKTGDTKNMYLLDSGKGKIVVVSADGVYQKQFSAKELHEATSLVVDEAAEIAYVSANGKLYTLSLR